MIIYVDFDGTICPNSGGPPSFDCLKTLTKLRESGATIVIYSCRSNPEVVGDADASTDEMIRYLESYSVPYDGIRWGKQYYNFFIDDRNVGTKLDAHKNVDWKEIYKNMKREGIIYDQTA